MTQEHTAIFLRLRRQYHENLCKNVLGILDKKGVPNVADVSSKNSLAIASLMTAKMDYPFCASPPVAQSADALFGRYTAEYILSAFECLNHLRPGKWQYTATGATGIGGFEQYKHLLDLKQVHDKNPSVKALLGGAYLVSPDIIIARTPVTDDEINQKESLVADMPKVARLSPLRASNQGAAASSMLHASISCKWTMRSDRSHNTPSEVFSPITNRKGATPHIATVTLEPLPTRLASIAMGTNDVDCTYHAALYELKEAVEEGGFEDQAEMLHTLIEGRRLRDISDLPLDIAI
jgi:hypothetical protein